MIHEMGFNNTFCYFRNERKVVCPDIVIIVCGPPL